jgi:exodeoxyribonuclease V gamma subunit
VLPALLEGWQAGMEAPLPVALRTALACVREERPDLVYEGSFTHTGEVADPCLARLFEDFEALTADGRFEAWAMRLYAPLAAWVAQRVQIEMHGTGLETLAEEEG